MASQKQQMQQVSGLPEQQRHGLMQAVASAPPPPAYPQLAQQQVLLCKMAQLAVLKQEFTDHLSVLIKSIKTEDLKLAKAEEHKRKVEHEIIRNQEYFNKIKIEICQVEVQKEDIVLEILKLKNEVIQVQKEKEENNFELFEAKRSLDVVKNELINTKKRLDVFKKELDMCELERSKLETHEAKTKQHALSTTATYKSSEKNLIAIQQQCSALKSENDKLYRSIRSYLEKGEDLEYIDSLLMKNHVQTIERLERELQTTLKKLKDNESVATASEKLGSSNWFGFGSQIETYKNKATDAELKQTEIYVKMRLLEEERLREKIQERRTFLHNLELMRVIKELKSRADLVVETIKEGNVAKDNVDGQRPCKLPSYMQRPHTVQEPDLSPIQTLRSLRLQEKKKERDHSHAQ